MKRGKKRRKKICQEFMDIKDRHMNIFEKKFVHDDNKLTNQLVTKLLVGEEIGVRLFIARTSRDR